MDYTSKLVLILAAGTGLGWFLGQAFGDHMAWMIIANALIMATSVSIETIHNVRGPDMPLKDKKIKTWEDFSKKMPPRKPPEPHF